MKVLGEREFDNIKAYVKTGHTYKEISDLTGRSSNVIWRAANCGSYDEYLDATRKNNLGYKRTGRRSSEPPILDDAMFALIKSAQAKGFTTKEMIKLFGYGHSTIDRVRQSNTLGDYRKIVREKNIPNVYRSNTSDEQFELIKELLEKILDKLECIDEAKMPRRLFK